MYKAFGLVGGITICLLFISVCNAQLKPFKQQMFDDLEVKNQITLTEGDTVWTFEIKALDEDTQPAPDRRYYWYTKEQIKNTRGNYSGKVLHGKFEKFDRQGNLLEKGSFSHGLKTGPWISYYSNGNIARTMEWKDGFRSGGFAEYYSEGTLARSGNYNKNKLSGSVTTYQADGSVTSAIRYKNGIAVVKPVKKSSDSASVQKSARQLKRETRKAEAKQKKELKATETVAPPADPAILQQEPDQKRKRKKKSEPEKVQP